MRYWLLDFVERTNDMVNRSYIIFNEICKAHFLKFIFGNILLIKKKSLLPTQKSFKCAKKGINAHL
jgi:hypothetical protein